MDRFSPNHPPRFSDIDPATWDPDSRLRWMDDCGIYAQTLYSNLGMFNLAGLQKDPGLMLEICRTYNDFQTEWCSTASDRLLPLTQLPFWDLEATLTEIERGALAGHRGVVFTQEPANYGLPPLVNEHWDPMWARLQEMGLPVNFHVGTSRTRDEFAQRDDVLHLDKAGGIVGNVLTLTGNLKTISQLIVNGICHRFPRLNFVSVESGIGWIPFLLEELDWQWKNVGFSLDHPEYELLPSEYFRRQIFGCFWFESGSAIAAIEQIGADNILYETDFPHPTCMSPGPATSAIKPIDYLKENFAHLPDTVLSKVLHDNAARIYHLD